MRFASNTNRYGERERERERERDRQKEKQKETQKEHKVSYIGAPRRGKRGGGGSTAIGRSGWSGGKAGSAERCFPPLAVLSYIPNSDIPTAKLND